MRRDTTQSMDSLPPEVRQALIQLLIAAIRELIALITHIVAQLTGATYPQPLPTPPNAQG